MASVQAPRVTGGWMLRRAHQMRATPLDFLVACSAEFESVVELPIPGRPVFYLSDPDAIAHVLQGNHRGYGKDTVQYRSLSAVTGDGLLVSDGAKWLRSRRLMQPAFGSNTLGALGQHVGIAVDRLSETWWRLSPGTLVDIDRAMMRTTLDVVGRALFSTDFGPAAARLPGAVQQALERVVARARTPVPLPAWVPSPGNVRLRRAVGVLDQTVADTVRERRASTAVNPDLLDLLLSSFGSDDGDSDEAEDASAVRDQMVTLVVAGHETVASALTWALWLVAGNPAVADKLATEARAVLGGRAPTAADSPKLPYARQVLDETLRLYPPAWVLSRRALAADEVAGVQVPAGSLVFMSPYALHRRPALWPDPERFDPDRFERDRVETGDLALPTCRSVPGRACASAVSSPCWKERSS